MHAVSCLRFVQGSIRADRMRTMRRPFSPTSVILFGSSRDIRTAEPKTFPASERRKSRGSTENSACRGKISKRMMIAQCAWSGLRQRQMPSPRCACLLCKAVPCAPIFTFASPADLPATCLPALCADTFSRHVNRPFRPCLPPLSSCGCLLFASSRRLFPRLCLDLRQSLTSTSLLFRTAPEMRTQDARFLVRNLPASHRGERIATPRHCRRAASQVPEQA